MINATKFNNKARNILYLFSTIYPIIPVPHFLDFKCCTCTVYNDTFGPWLNMYLGSWVMVLVCILCVRKKRLFIYSKIISLFCLLAKKIFHTKETFWCSVIKNKYLYEKKKVHLKMQKCFLASR